MNRTEAEHWFKNEIGERMDIILSPETEITDPATAREWALRELWEEVEDYPKEFSRLQKQAVLQAALIAGFLAPVTEERYQRTWVSHGDKARIFYKIGQQRYEFTEWKLTK